MFSLLLTHRSTLDVRPLCHMLPLSPFKLSGSNTQTDCHIVSAKKDSTMPHTT